MRICAKLRCRTPASATVVLRYEEREVLVGDLTAEADPNLVDLCADHAGRLTPPIGWTLSDTRTAVPAAI